ncbi:cytochrome B5 [Candidatus Bathyarchaeota archaeon]|nr:cytochrome B5 [Candidatus Bathyarchaeota archaeon]
MKEFTEKELAEYNGKNGKPAYIAYKGKVFDVSSSFLWKNGKHQVLHEAGADLTAALQQAPHGEDVFKKFPIVGILRKKETRNV